MRGKRICLAILATLTSATLLSPCFAQTKSHCPGEDHHEQEDNVVHLYTGAESAYYNEVGNAIAAASKHTGGEIRVHACVSEGSASNIDALLKGDADFAIVQSDVVHQVWHCEGKYAKEAEYAQICATPRKPSPIRLITPLFMEKAQILLRPHLYVSSLSDLRGHCIWTGVAGSGSEPTARILLEAAGWTEDEISAAQSRCKPSPKSLDDALAALGKGQNLDAVIQTRVAPSREILQALTDYEIQLLGIDWSIVQRMSHDDIYRETSIQKTDYSSAHEGLYTVAVQALLLTRNSEDPDAIRALAEMIQGEQPDIEHHLQRILQADDGARGDVNADWPAMVDGHMVGPTTLTLIGSKLPPSLESHVDPDADQYLWHWSIRRGTLIRLAGLLLALAAVGAFLGLHPRGRALAGGYCRELLFVASITVVWLFAAIWLQAIEGDLNEHFTSLSASALSLAENVAAKLPLQLSFSSTPTTHKGATLVSVFSYIVVSLLAIYALPWLKDRWQWVKPRLLGMETHQSAEVTPKTQAAPAEEPHEKQDMLSAATGV